MSECADVCATSECRVDRELLLSSFPFDFLLFSLLAMVGYKNPAIATQSGHWLPQPCIAWNKIKK